MTPAVRLGRRKQVVQEAAFDVAAAMRKHRMDGSPTLKGNEPGIQR